MRILMLCPQLNNSSYLVSYLFARALQKEHEVTMMGPTFGGKPFIEQDEVDVKILNPIIRGPVQFGMATLYNRNLSALLKIREKFDVIHPFKLLPHTSPVGAAIKKKLGKPFVLTIDDYDPVSPKNPLKRMILKMAESSYKSADKITVSSRLLQKVYGGEIVYQVADEKMFNPASATGKKIRQKLGLNDKIVVAYIGTVFEHKGVDVLIRAVQSLKRDDVKLLLFKVGGDVERCMSISGPETIWTDRIDFKDSPDYTAACDIYAIPTKDTLYARAQTPMKIFEAMAMGKPILASRISDIPVFLDGGRCGSMVKPGNQKELEAALRKLVDDKSYRESLGKRAKSFYSEKFGQKQLQKKLLDMYADLA